MELYGPSLIFHLPPIFALMLLIGSYQPAAAVFHISMLDRCNLPVEIFIARAERLFQRNKVIERLYLDSPFFFWSFGFASPPFLARGDSFSS